MVKHRQYSSSERQHGVLLIEVLITMIIVVLGLLGLAGLQVQLQKNEIESYQRSQALLLLNDMANRIATNRNSAASYVTGSGSPTGTEVTCPTSTTTVVDSDKREWCLALQGAAETTGANTKAGAMVGGRGCVESVDGDYMVTVVWQGLIPTSAPPTSVQCGAGSYNGASGSTCVEDRCRRYVTTLVRVATLTP